MSPASHPTPTPTPTPSPSASPATSPSRADDVPPQAEPLPERAPVSVRMRMESKFPRGLVIRLIAYLFVGHLFAFFVYLLFVLGGQNQ
ncbi:DUF6126 family protein [Streptomyces sp. CB00455]|uniref:DUF6126 family protein n=1 Tax=Streptomyces sp. CB00455 TaxID=1703927 RepID=UPI000AB4333A